MRNILQIILCYKSVCYLISLRTNILIVTCRFTSINGNDNESEFDYSGAGSKYVKIQDNFKADLAFLEEESF